MKRAKTWLNAAAILVGFGILAGIAWQLGWEEVREHISRVGWGFLWLCACHAASLAFEVVAWFIATDFKGGFWRLYRAAMAGAAVNAVTPLGELGEAVKVGLVGKVLPMPRAISSVLVWNLCFRFTKHLVIALSLVLVVVALPDMLTWPQVGAFVVAILASSATTILLFVAVAKGSAEFVVRFVSRFSSSLKESSDGIIEAARGIDTEVRAYAGTRRRHAAAMCGLLVVARLCSAAEVYAVLILLGEDVTLVSALFLYSAGQVLRVFVSLSPVQIGVAEGGEAFLYRLLGFPLTIGFTQAFLRALRWMLFNAVGMAALAYDNFSGGEAADREQQSE